MHGRHGSIVCENQSRSSDRPRAARWLPRAGDHLPDGRRPRSSSTSKPRAATASRYAARIRWFRAMKPTLAIASPSACCGTGSSAPGWRSPSKRIFPCRADSAPVRPTQSPPCLPWNVNCKQPLAAAERLRIAAEVGSDLPLFLLGGTVLGVGRGEQVYPLARASCHRLRAGHAPGRRLHAASVSRLG